MVLVVSCDLVLGPLITFTIFDKRKPWPELRRDLAIVVALQLAALGYGLHTVIIARPVVLALEEDRFRVVAAPGVLETELPRAPGQGCRGQVLVCHEACDANERRKEGEAKRAELC